MHMKFSNLKSLLILPIISGLSLNSDIAASKEFELPLYDGWGKETIPFPLKFAPEIKLEGVEELRFSPGMFSEDSEEYWSYFFVWWLDSDIGLL